jgi:hypothetical protein
MEVSMNKDRKVYLQIVKTVWEHFGTTPIDENECLDISWAIFSKGTHKEEVWHWFEETYEVPVHALLYPSEHPEIWDGFDK